MENKSNYIRVGTSYFKVSQKPLSSGDVMKVLITWNRETIVHDHGKDELSKVPRYDGWCIIPSHTQYKQEYKNYLNRYEPLPIKSVSGQCSRILEFLKHVFQDQFELGLDYLTILYQQPTQLLPVLCLVSKQRETGKTTFLNLLKIIFGGNMTYNSNSDFRSNFNIDWLNKLIIAVDEVLLDRKEDSERIKNLSTAKSFKAEAKGQDKFETEFFGKFILCSNNEDNFIIIDPQETRYWVRKLEPLQNKNPFLLEEMKNEIPQFQYLLQERELTSEKKSRMWFTAEQICTTALKKVKSQYHNKIEMELYDLIKEIIELKDLDSFKFTNTNAKALLDRAGFKVSRSAIRKILEDSWKLKQHDNSSNYRTYLMDSSGFLVEMPAEKGRYYTVQKEDLNRLLDEMIT